MSSIRIHFGTHLRLKSHIPRIPPLIPQPLQRLPTRPTHFHHRFIQNLEPHPELKRDIRRFEVVGEEVDGGEEVLRGVVDEGADEAVRLSERYQLEFRRGSLGLKRILLTL